MAQRIIFTNEVQDAVSALIHEMNPSRVFVVADENTARVVVPQMNVEHDKLIVVSAGDENKNLESAQIIWDALQTNGATRHSLVINVGGGMVTDLGGFAAATFKRGLQFVNLPTTLLGAVDASVGGKTGINYHSLKNEIGVFAPAHAVVISSRFFATLPHREFLSGYAEMIKHALLDSEAHLHELLTFPVQEVDAEKMLEMLRKSVHIKEQIVMQDPEEKGLRKALNLGHTVGHAFESLALRRNNPVPHGYAVACGLVTELVLSHMLMKFPSGILQQTATFVLENYGAFPITCKDYDTLLSLMAHDKKSLSGEINCTLLADCGNYKTDVSISPEDMKAALDIYCDLLHL